MPGVFAVSNQLCLGDWFEHLCSQQVVRYPAVTGAQLYAGFLPILWTFWVKRSWIEERLCRLNSFAWQLFQWWFELSKRRKRTSHTGSKVWWASFALPSIMVGSLQVQYLRKREMTTTRRSPTKWRSTAVRSLESSAVPMWSIARAQATTKRSESSKRRLCKAVSCVRTGSFSVSTEEMAVRQPFLAGFPNSETKPRDLLLQG